MTQPTEDNNVPLSILAHRAESERLLYLVQFLNAFAPAMGESREFQSLKDEDADPKILKERDRVVLAAFQAVGRIVSESFNFHPSQNVNRKGNA